MANKHNMDKSCISRFARNRLNSDEIGHVHLLIEHMKELTLKTVGDVPLSHR